jgi:hypothetical protein
MGLGGGAYWRLSGVILAKAGIHECMDSRLQPALDLIGGGNDGWGMDSRFRGNDGEGRE